MTTALRAAAPHRLVLLALVGLALALRPWLAPSDAEGPARDGTYQFVVTTSEDAGRGSLRETLFRANRAAGPARVEINVSNVTLHVPLPPLANPDGIHLIGLGESVVVTGPPGGTIPLIDIVSPRTVIEGLTVDAPGAVCVRATARAQIRNSIVRRCEIGVLLAGKAKGTEITATRFEENVTGLRVDGVDGAVRIRDNEFARHSDFAVWIGGDLDGSRGPVRSTVSENSFEGDRVAILLAGGSAVVSNNLIVGGREAGIMLGGSGHSVVGNRVRDGERAGILVESAERASVERNTVEDNGGVGILVRSGSSVMVRDNEVHRNGYGLMFLLGSRLSPSVAHGNVASGNRFDGIAVVGASPVLRENVASGNRWAGLRIDDWMAAGDIVASDPLVERNRLSNNGENGPVRGRHNAS